MTGYAVAGSATPALGNDTAILKYEYSTVAPGTGCTGCCTDWSGPPCRACLRDRAVCVVMAPRTWLSGAMLLLCSHGSSPGSLRSSNADALLMQISLGAAALNCVFIIGSDLLLLLLLLFHTVILSAPL